MEVGVRSLTVLKRFEPFGLTVEASDNGNGKLNDGKYQYLLFDPEITRERGDVVENDVTSSSCNDYDHELFVRGNRVTWSSSSQVCKRFTAPSTIIKACWCRMESMSEPLLCVLHLDSLTTYTPSGEMVSVPSPTATASIWPVPFGLLLQKAADENHLCSGGSSSPGPSIPATRELGRVIRESFSGPFNNSASPTVQRPTYDHRAIFSHYILKHPLEEPQALLVEERGKTYAMKDPEEQILWTSDIVPYIVTYHRGKMQHSIWQIKAINSKVEAGSVISTQSTVYIGEQSKALCLLRMWQDKCAQSIANQVFLATDDDGVSLICFVFKDKKRLISIRLPSKEAPMDLLFDIKLDVSWSIPAIAAKPIIMTRSRLKIRGLKQFDMLILAPDGNLFLYVGHHRLCTYILPLSALKELNLQSLSSNQYDKTIGVEEIQEKVEIIGLCDAVRERINLITSSGEVFRCALRAAPASGITEDCINALAEGLSPMFFQHFLTSFWGHECSTLVSGIDFKVDVEWEAFYTFIMGWIRNVRSTSLKQQGAKKNSAWEFLLHSKMHSNYMRNYRLTGLSLPLTQSSLCFPQSELSPIAAPTQDPSFYVQLLKEVLDALHAVYEDYKLDILHRQDLWLLVHLLTCIATCLGEANYVDHYLRDFPGLLPHFSHLSKISGLKNPANLFQWLQNCMKYDCNSTNKECLPALLLKEGTISVDWSRKVVSFYGLLFGSRRTGKHLASGVSFSVASGTANTPEEFTVLSMVAEGFGLQQLDRLPFGVSLPLRHALDRCRESPPVDWPAPAYVLVGREDLASTTMGRSASIKSPYKVQCVSDHLNLISMSVPYTLHLHPVIAPSLATDLYEAVDPEMERPDSADESITDGMEHIFNTTTQLRFGRDLRLNEVKHLLCSTRPVSVPPVSNGGSEQQQARLLYLTHRTTALPFGRGAFTLATTWTLLTEVLTVPKLNVLGVVPSENNATVNFPTNMASIADTISWPEFHNGVAAGLRIAPFQARMSRTWIMYNKPDEPNFSHAGLLLALGLHGHLRVLASTDVYDYLSQYHEATITGLLLGLGASHRGTMNPRISKMFYLHIPSRHPPSFPELEITIRMQSAALMAVGLLYQESAHPIAMKILIDEIGRKSSGDNVLERQGYAIAAGLALGLVTLGRGKDASGFADTLVDRLFQYISGGKDPSNETNLTATCILDDASQNTGQVMDASMVNIDVTAPAAIVALALMFLKTECDVVASRLSVPDTNYDLQFVRPDFILLRVIARNMILWDRIYPSEKWIEDQIPDIVKEGVSSMEDNEINLLHIIDIEASVQAFVNIIAGACFSIGLRYAGTANADAQELLHHYSLYFLKEIKPAASSRGDEGPKLLTSYVDRSVLETCLNVTILSLSVVMAGTGHLQTFRLLRYLRLRNDAHIKYGNHMAVSLAIGFLFLGGGMRTFATNNGAIAALLITLYPTFPTKPDDNDTHLQAFRHLYVLATEARCVQTVDVDTGRTVYTPLEITIRETRHHAETTYCRVTPCILPERSVLKRVQVCGPRYWPQDIELSPADHPWWGPRDKHDPFNGGILYVKRKVGACSYADDPTGCQSLLSRVMHKVSDGSKGLSSGTKSHGPGLSKVDQLVGTFSADPSLLAFAQLCCDNAWKNGTDNDFQEFCLQVLFDCVSTDRPALLQTYLYLYTTVGSLADCATLQGMICNDTLFLSSVKVAVAYYGALVDGKLQSARGELIQSTFLASIAKRVEDILCHWQHLPMKQHSPYSDLVDYLTNGKWPLEPPTEPVQRNLLPSIFLAYYLRWYDVPPAPVVNSAMQKVMECFPRSFVSAGHNPNPRIPLLGLMLPGTHVHALSQIDECYPCAS